MLERRKSYFAGFMQEMGENDKISEKLKEIGNDGKIDNIKCYYYTKKRF